MFTAAFPLVACETSDDQDLQLEKGPATAPAEGKLEVLDSDQLSPGSSTPSVGQLLLRRGLLLLLMIVVLTTGVLTAKLLSKLLKQDE